MRRPAAITAMPRSRRASTRRMRRRRGISRHRLSMDLLRLRRPPPLSGDLAAVKQAIDLVRKAKTGEATAIEKTIGDPAAQKLVEWLILRHPDAEASFGRYAAFIADNPSWPSMGPLRRRAEARLWQERSDAATVRSFTGGQPASGRGRFALARVLLAEGDRTAPKARFARPGGRRSCRNALKPTRSTRSAISSRATTIGHAWTSASAPRIFRARCAPRIASETTTSRS